LRAADGAVLTTFNESFPIRTGAQPGVSGLESGGGAFPAAVAEWYQRHNISPPELSPNRKPRLIVALPPDAVRLVPGSSWGTFTIACTIPIALFVGLYMYKIRPGKVVEASIIE